MRTTITDEVKPGKRRKGAPFSCWGRSAQSGRLVAAATAIDAAAKNFYRMYGFHPLWDDVRHLYLSLATLETTAAQANRGPVR
jgi:hypothetical protein